MVKPWTDVGALIRYYDALNRLFWDCPRPETGPARVHTHARTRPVTHRWLPEGQGAVATFCSIPTAQRAARKIPGGPGGVRAAPLPSCPPEILQRALAGACVRACMPEIIIHRFKHFSKASLFTAQIPHAHMPAGLVIPPRPKADTAAPSRLIIGALGIRSPSSTRPPVTRSQAAESARGDAKEKGQGSGTPSSREPPPTPPPSPPQPPSRRRRGRQ